MNLELLREADRGLMCQAVVICDVARCPLGYARLCAHDYPRAANAFMQLSAWFPWFSRTFLASAVVVGLPAAYLTFALNRRSWTPQTVALVMAIAIGLIALSLGFARLSVYSRALRVIVIGGALILIGTICWNYIYAEHARQPDSDTSRGEFRKNRNSRHWPIYGVYEFHGVPRAIPAVVAMAGTVGYLIRAQRRRTRVDGRFLTTLALLTATTTLSFAFAEERLGRMVLSDGFRFGLEQFEGGSARNLMSRYVELQPLLGSFNSHYPPGFMLLYRWERVLGVPIVAPLVFITIPLTVFPLARIVRELGGDDSAQRWALGLYCTAMGVLVFATITPIALLVLIATTTLLWLVMTIRATTPARAIGFGAALGMTSCVFALFSFSVAMLAVFGACVVTLFLLIERNGRLMRLQRIALAMSATVGVVIACYFIVRATTGFDWLACLAESQRNLIRSNGDYFDTPLRYALRASGNVLAYLFSCGIVLAVPAMFGALQSVRGRSGALSQSWRFATPIALLIATCIGMGRLETERVWLFFTPVLCIAAAMWYAERDAERDAQSDRSLFALVMIASGIFACAVELTYQHY